MNRRILISGAGIGGPALAHTNALFNASAVNALNALAGSVGEEGGIFFTPQAFAAGPGATRLATAWSSSRRPAAPSIRAGGPQSIARCHSVTSARSAPGTS